MAAACLASAPIPALAQSYNFTTLDSPTAAFPGGATSAYGINNLGQVVGATNAAQGGFLYRGGSYTTIAYPTPPAFGTTPQGINDLGQITGAMVADIRTVGTGFVFSGGTYTALPIGNVNAGLIDTVGWGINNSGKIVGTYLQGRGFIYSGGGFTSLVASASGDTVARSINNGDQVVGYYENATFAGNVSHGFLYSGGTFTTIDPSPGSQTQIYGINDSSQIVGIYDNGGGPQSFVKIGGTFYTINKPGATTTIVSGINNAGQIVGTYVDANGTHGFVASPTSVTITLQGFDQTVGSLSGGGTVTNGSAVAGTLTTGIDNNSTSFGGTIQDGAGMFSLKKVGAGTLMLSGANTYSGGTTLSAGAIQIGNNSALGTGTLAMAAGTTLSFDGANHTLTNNIVISGDPIFAVGAGTTQTISGVISDATPPAPAGIVEKQGAGALILSGANTYSGGTVISGGVLQVTNSTPGASSSVGTGVVTLDGGTFQAGANNLVFSNGFVVNTTGGTIDTNSNTLTLSGVLQDGNGTTGLITKVGGGTLVLSGLNTYEGGTTISGGVLRIGADSVFNTPGNPGSGIRSSAIGLGTLTFDGGALQAGGNFTLANAAKVNATGGIIDANGFHLTYAGVISDGSGPGQLIVTDSSGAGGIVTLAAANTYSGGTLVDGATLQLSGAGKLGATAGTTTIGNNGTLDLGGTTQTQASLNLNGGFLKNGSLNGSVNSTGGAIVGIGGSASVTTTAGLTVLTGIDGYTGPTTVNGGILEVDGTLTGTSGAAVNAGGALTGSGTIDAGTVNINSGSIFAPGSGTPGSSMSITGNLAFQSGAIYLVQINPKVSSFVTVTGAAALGGATVNATFAAGSYVAKQYAILSAAGGVSGSFNSGLVNTNLPTGFKASLSYDSTHAYLDLVLNFTPSPPGPAAPSFGGGLSGNQQAVGNSLINFFNTTGSIPIVFGTVTPSGLSQLSGENATGSQQTAFNAMTQFMNVMSDPFISGRQDGFSGEPPSDDRRPLGFAEDGARNETTNAYAALDRQSRPTLPFARRWSAWTSAFGGSQTTDGNGTLGSNSAISSIYGTAVGADYRLSPDLRAGFALAGAGTNFSVNNAGAGRSDLFQAGAFVRGDLGAAYATATLAYGWQHLVTDRTITIAGLDKLHAEFDANTYAGRVESGYRFATPWIAITPYAAGQFAAFDLPAYTEQAVIGSNIFALSYAAKSVTDARSELGVRTDKSLAMPSVVVTLRSRLAWAHDFDPDRSVSATFLSLPGASFVVNGAAQAHDSALTTLSAEATWPSGWSTGLTFEGEFSQVTSSYAGKGTARFTW